ncbi:hypothetical protein ACA910_016838 [Epithemia clementina (nom. ined.)]
MSAGAARKIFWKVGSPIPEELSNCLDPFSSCLVPRMLAWLTVDDTRVTLLDGYTAGSYSPPFLFFSASAIPSDFLRVLRHTKVCTLSMATTREPSTAYDKAAIANSSNRGGWTQPPTFHSFAELGLEAKKTKDQYPSVITTSPIHMHCSLEKCVSLTENGSDDDDSNDNSSEKDAESSEAIIILTVESFVIDGSILSQATEMMKKRPGVVAKIDAELIQPVVSLGSSGRRCTLKAIHSMPRPIKAEDTETTTTRTTTTTSPKWTSTDFNIAEPSTGPGAFDTVEWNFREHGATSPLGYSATIALVMPRPIGWISTYHHHNNTPDGHPMKLTHLAPYSFFCNVSRSLQCPMVAFSGFQKEGKFPKDAQNDAEQSKCFVYNMVTQDLAVPMNLSAAELPREESEFAMAELTVQEAALVHAPMVQDSPIQMECEYVKSIPMGSFCIVVGRVVGIHVSSSVVTDQQIDVTKLRVITRLGYMDEYGTLAMS